MDLGKELQQHYAEVDTEQERLKQMYAVQQTEIGQASLSAKKELAGKLRSKGIDITIQEVGYMVNAKNGEKRYYMKG